MGGSFRFTSTTITNSTAISGGPIVTVRASPSGSLLVLTHVELRQQACDDSVFLFLAPAQVFVRNVTFSPMPGCSSVLAFSADIENSIKGCDATIFDPVTETSSGVCAPFASCASQDVTGTVLSGLTCECAKPNLADPAHDHRTAPYEDGGCIQPRSMRDLFIVAREVNVVLAKPGDMLRSLNLTLEMQGDDFARPARWSVTNHPNLEPWVRLPITSGWAEGDAPHIELTLNATGLREKAHSYTETLLIYVAASVQADDPEYLAPTLAAVARTVSVAVSLRVQAATSFAVWGRVRSDALCVKPFRDAAVNVSATTDEPLRMAFTACDAENLPVNHQLPIPSDPRRFIASLNASNTAPELADIEYRGGAYHDVVLNVPTYGPFVLIIELGGVEISRLTGTSVCSREYVTLPDGRCGCPAEQEIRDGQCRVCAEGKHKPRAGNGLCTDKPLVVWPFVFGAGGALASIVSFAMLQSRAEKRRIRREKKLERDFLAVT